MKLIIVFTALISLSAYANQINDQTNSNLNSKPPQVLQQLSSVERSIKYGESHSYLIETKGSHFIFGEVEQDSIDVKIQVFAPNGLEINAFNETKVGYEPFIIDTQMSGQYKILLSASEKDSSGMYSIRLIRNEVIASDLNKRLEQLLSPYDKQTTPGAVFGVFEKGNVTHIQSVGMANLAHTIPFEVDMPTNIGSVSKQFTAMAILLLEKQGKLSLTDDLRKHLPELPEFSDKITIKHVLTHTTGLREIFNLLGMRGWTGEEFIEKNQALEVVKKQVELQVKPGEKMNYNNTGFTLLSIIVERVTEQTFSKWMKENIFEPLDMNNTYVRRDPGHIIPRATQGYGVDENGFREVGDLYSAVGAGAIYTTVEDMAKWSQNYITGKLGGKNVITKLTTRGVLNNGEEQTYALGLSVNDYRGLLRYMHSGADMAHYTNYVFFPEIDKGLFLNTNNTAFNMSIWNRFVDEVVGKDFVESTEGNAEEGEIKIIDLPANYLAKLTGKYKSELLGVVADIKATEEQLKIAFDDGDAQPLTTYSEKEFGFNDGQYKLTFLMNNDEASASALTIKTSSDDYEFKKLEPFDPTHEQLNEYTGRYFSNELEVLYTIAINEKNKLTVKLYTSPTLELVPLEQDTFSETSMINTDLIFIRNEIGKVTKLELSNGRTQGVVFERMP